ncbi:MAG TPA: hypothetical protein VKT78_04515 [Fimbriimonadaceae bacterium]|nr:hypothetical protein [Fimbriimonadaceae bacterium]
MVPILVLALSAVRPAIAFTARYYFRDSRHSVAQVYTCDLLGKHRRQITHERKDCDSVRWDGANRLVYAVSGGFVKEIDLRSGKVRVVRHSPGTLDEAYGETLRFARGRNTYPVYRGWNEGSITVHAGRVVAHGHPLGYGRNQLPVRTKLGVVEVDQHSSLVLQDRRRSVKLFDGLDAHMSGVEDIRVARGRLFFTTFSTFSSWHAVHHLRVLRPNGIGWIASGHELEADLSKEWVGWVEHRDLDGFQGKSLWVAGAGLTNLRTGKTVHLVSGLAWAGSIALGPDVP